MTAEGMDHYADDLAELIEHLDLTNLILFGFSTGGGEVARYIARHGTSQLLVYTGAPHGLTDTHKQQANEDMLRFAQF